MLGNGDITGRSMSEPKTADFVILDQICVWVTVLNDSITATFNGAPNVHQTVDGHTEGQETSSVGHFGEFKGLSGTGRRL